MNVFSEKPLLLSVPLALRSMIKLPLCVKQHTVNLIETRDWPWIVLGLIFNATAASYFVEQIQSILIFNLKNYCPFVFPMFDSLD